MAMSLPPSLILRIFLTFLNILYYFLQNKFLALKWNAMSFRWIHLSLVFPVVSAIYCSTIVLNSESAQLNLFVFLRFVYFFCLIWKTGGSGDELEMSKRSGSSLPDDFHSSSPHRKVNNNNSINKIVHVYFWPNVQ